MAKAATTSGDGTSGFRSESHQLQASNYAPQQSWKEGDKVKMTLRFRGREMATRNSA